MHIKGSACTQRPHITISTTRSHLPSFFFMPSDLPLRQKSQRLANRSKAEKPHYFAQYKQSARTVSSANELLPGLNDILDAFEALPLDLVKYFTLLKEIDAKCINTVPLVRRHIHTYLESLHDPAAKKEKAASLAELARIRRHVHELVPCLEEKMHVTAVAADVLAKHMHRINGDYRVVIGNNEIPESVRIGSLTHRAIVLDPLAQDNSKLAQLQRSESRREALAAKKAGKDGDDDDNKRRRAREPTPVERRRDKAPTPVADRKRSKPKKEEPGRGGGAGEPTYCYCNQVLFGEMVGCDGDSCKREWFHLPCIGFKNPPKGKWYCDECLAKAKKRRI